MRAGIESGPRGCSANLRLSRPQVPQRLPALIAARPLPPLPAGWQADPEPALAERQRQVDQALAPAAVEIGDLPGELVPHAAWLLCEHLCDQGHRARAGEIVPGAHLFLFHTGSAAWRHAVAVDGGAAARATEVLRASFRSWAAGGRASAGLLVRVSDAGRVAARKLVWQADGQTRETPNLPRAGDTLPAEDFRRALADLQGVVADAFIVDDAERLAALFTSQPGLGEE